MKKKVTSGKIRVRSNDKVKSSSKKNVGNNKNNVTIKKIRGSVIRNRNIRSLEDTQVVRVSKSMIRETKVDKEIESTENVSVVMMAIIIIICFAVGIAIGYMLYNISIESSNSAYIVKNILKL